MIVDSVALACCEGPSAGAEQYSDLVTQLVTSHGEVGDAVAIEVSNGSNELRAEAGHIVRGCLESPAPLAQQNTYAWGSVITRVGHGEVEIAIAIEITDRGGDGRIPG